MTRRTAALALAGAFLVSAPAAAQDMPDGWLMRFDRANAGSDMVDFQLMEPGWHITTGRSGAGIFWKPDMAATGEFSAAVSYHLFSPRSHAESFGLFLGGQDLEEADQEYLYFLVRQTGEYLIKRRRESETANVVGWTLHRGIPTATPGEQGPTRYDLAVDVAEDGVAFMVNGAVVHTLPRSQVSTDGHVGLRINHMLNVHVEELAVRPAM